jgi:hypothetical protein
MTIRRAVLVAGALALASSTCNDSPTGASQPVKGFLEISMTTPTNDDGGIMLVVSGGVVDSVRSSYPNVLSRSESASSTRIIVGGNLTGGKIVEIWVPDTRKVADYSATVLEVAARGNFTQRATGGYTLTVARPQ